MGKVDRFMVWMNMLICPMMGGAASQNNKLCDEIEQRYPIKLGRADSGGRQDLICAANAIVMLDYLKILEKEEEIG